MRVAALFRRRHLESELGAEMQTLFEMVRNEHLRRGMSMEEASHAARRSLGGVEQIKERYRDQRGIPLVEALGRDVRFGLRTLRGTPGFTVVAVLTLALGIGAGTAIFSLVDAVLLRPLPFREPHRLVMVGEHHRTFVFPGTHVAPENFLDWRSQSTTFEDLAAYHGDAANLTGGDPPERLDIMRVTPNLFAVLGVEPALGRGSSNVTHRSATRLW